MRGRDIYFRQRTRGGPHGLSRRNGIFETRRCPESNNTESSFNKGLATIYRGHTSHSHLSASTRTSSPPYLTLRLSYLSHNLPQQTPFILWRSYVGADTPGRHRSLFLSIVCRYANIFFHNSSVSRARDQYQIADAFALRERYFSTDLLHYFNERNPIGRRDPFRSRVSPSDTVATVT